MLQVSAADHMAYYSLRPLMQAARNDGWIVEFACADGDYAKILRAEGFRHRSIPMSRSGSPVKQIRALSALVRSLRREKPDLMHTHTPIGGVIGRTAARIAGIGTIVHTLHGLPFEGRPKSASGQLYLLAERALLSSTDLFMSQSRSDAALAEKFGIAHKGRTAVVGNGVDIERFKPDRATRDVVRAQLEIPANSVVVSTVARLVREKGLLELAEAAYELRADDRLVFLIVGRSEPSDRSHLEEALRRHPAAAALGRRWRLLGRRDDAHRILQASDLFVLPTYREGLPRSIIEAMACGLPVIATDIPGCAELVESNHTGHLVRARDAMALSHAIRTLVDAPAARFEMGRRARVIAERHHDERAIASHQLALLGGLCRGRRSLRT